jgi:hypothetical protein
MSKSIISITVRPRFGAGFLVVPNRSASADSEVLR